MTAKNYASTADTTPRLLCSARLNLALVMFLGCGVLYALRGNISFALVCMVDPDAAPADDSRTAAELSAAKAATAAAKCNSNSTFLNAFKSDETHKSGARRAGGEFGWSKRTQGAILSAFFFGYMTSQVAGGYLAQKVGAKRVVGATILACSLLTLLSPLAARANVGALILLRALLGVLQGAVFPAMHSMWALWAPPLERGLLTGLSYAGSQVGNVLVMPVSGVLCRHGFGGGWPSIFYVLGAVGVAWCGVWAFLVADTPQKHRRIARDEREYITGALGTTQVISTVSADIDDSENEEKVVHVKVPLGAILSSRAVWACFAGHFAGDWGAYTMATGLPLFMNDALGLDPTAMGILSSLPYIAYFVMINVGGFLADQIQKNGILSTLNTRRLAMISALGGQAFFLVLIGYVECGQEVWLIVFLTASLGISGFQYSGFIVNYLDICPAHAGTVVGIGQTISCLGGIISPLAIGFLTPTSSRAEWQRVFYLTAFVLVAGALVFAALASGSVQPWALPPQAAAAAERDDGAADGAADGATTRIRKTEKTAATALDEPLLPPTHAENGAAKQ